MEARKVDHIVSEIENLNENEILELMDRIKRIDRFSKYLEQQFEDKEYYKMVNESLSEVWDNEEDDVYNDL